MRALNPFELVAMAVAAVVAAVVGATGADAGVPFGFAGMRSSEGLTNARAPPPAGALVPMAHPPREPVAAAVEGGAVGGLRRASGAVRILPAAGAGAVQEADAGIAEPEAADARGLEDGEDFRLRSVISTFHFMN